MVSNALDRPKEMPKVDSFLSIEADAVEWLLRNPNFFEYKILCQFKNSISQQNMTSSKSLEKAGRIDISLYLKLLDHLP